MWLSAPRSTIDVPKATSRSSTAWPGGRFTGYHKVSVNGRHPTAYFQARKHSDERINRFAIRPEPWKTDGRTILVAGMGPKGSRAEGYAPQGWEKEAIALLRKHTGRQILYRPKPNVPHSQPIPGSLMVDKDIPLEIALRNVHAVVAHHSNAAVEALAMGRPVFVVEGVALPMGLCDLRKIETPAYPGGRRQWLSDVAWTQWSVEEMASGRAWRYLKDEGLVP